MSASTGPYTDVARGRLPIPPWARVVGVLAIFALVVAVMTWIYLLPYGRRDADAGAVHWNAGPPLALPAPRAEAAAPAPVPAPAPPPTAPVPAPAAPPAVAPPVRPMRVWGSEAKTGGSRVASAPAAGAERAGSESGALDARRRDGAEAGGDAEGTTTEYGQRLRPTRTADYEAGVHKDIGLLLAETTSFECLPQSPIDTQLVGGVSCIVGEDVWSADGSNILIDKGAIASGEIVRGLEQGQDRAFLLWRTVRSGRVYATLNSPATDELGQMGVPGVVREHLWRRIKAAVLLTGLEGLVGAGQAAVTRGRGNTYLNLNQGASLAQEALAHDINIPTTLWRGQAWPIRIYVQHNIQFRRAYNDRLVTAR